MKNMNVFYINIDDSDDSGMDAISLVKNGAVEVDFLYFNEQKHTQLNFFEEDKRIITGVVARADYPIYRRRGDYEYYVVFTKDVIRKLVHKYSKQGLFNSVNLDHNNYSFVKDVYMIESYIVDKERGICPKEFSDIEDGSWICSFSVDDDTLWNEIKNNNNFNAFSLQGLFLLEDHLDEEKHSKEDDFDSWVEDMIKETN